MVVLTSFSHPTDGIRHRQNNTTVYVNDNNLGKGTLYIAESCLSWVSDSGNGFSIEYPHISLHAVSRDLSAFPQECLFLMLDTDLGDDETNNGDGENEVEDENGSDGQGTTELRLVPDDRGMLDAMFHAMNACQALHPDPEDSFSDEDFFEDADDEVPVEEADSQMGRLRIENRDGRQYMSDRVLDMEGILGGINQGTRGVSGRISEDILEDMEEDILVGRVRGISGGMEEDISEGMGEDISEGTGEDISEGTGEDILGGTGVDILGGTGGDISVGRVGGILGRGVGREVGRGTSMALDMGRDDRPFSSGNTWHQGRSAVLPAAHSPHTAQEEDSNFADAEN